MLDSIRRLVFSILARANLLRRRDGSVIGLNPIGEMELRDMPRDGWYWGDSWQSAEKQAIKDLATGQYQDFRNLDELVRALTETDQDPLTSALRRRTP